MSVCLVTAPTSTEFRDFDELSSESVRWASSQPQLGILSLAAVVENRGDDLQIVNLNRLYSDHANDAQRFHLDGFAEAAAAEIGMRNADLYGFSSICSSYPLTIRIAQALKSIRPSSMILVGGPQASVVDLQTLAAFPFVDFVVRGEAERSFPVLLDHLQGQCRLEQVPGLSYRVNAQPCRSPDANVIDNLDELPMPAYHRTGELKKLKTAALELGRGCPYACTFCSTNDFFRRNFRLRSPQRVLLDMRSIAAEYGISDFELVHDMFTIDRRRVVAFCDAMLGSGENFTWSCSARTDCVDEELLETMARAGCTGIFYGVEVGSARMQRIINKDLDLERAKKVIDETERLGIHTTVSMIVGFPEETWQDVRETVQIYMHAARCPKSSPQLNLLAPLSETPIHSKYRDSLILDELCSDMSHQGGSQDEADLKLIRNYPDIFPNFYLLPMPYLDRDTLLEFREFALNTIDRFRWLVVAIDQYSSGITDFVLVWRQHRLALHPGMKGLDLRRYYRTKEFRSCFLTFVRQHPAGKHASVQTFLDFEDAVADATSADKGVEPNGSPVALGSELWWSDITVKRSGITLIEFWDDIQAVIDGLKCRSELSPARARHFYLVGRSGHVEEVSDWIACVLRNCDGRRTVRQVVKQLTDDLKEVEKSVREYVFLRLLQGAWEKGFIDIYRAAPTDTEASHSRRLSRSAKVMSKA
jgi:radical SAM superfamily enzyme YgiQ (UPF0313 family)